MPTASPEPLTTFSQPAGTPASAQMRPSSTQVSGASRAGFRTTALPAASAAARQRPAIWSG
jgi:hypothetical protein